LQAGRDVTRIAPFVFDGAAHLDVAERAAIQGRIEQVLRSGASDRLWPLALLAGAIVETGGDPADLPPVIYDRILEWFTAAAARPEPANDKEAEGFQLFPE